MCKTPVDGDVRGAHLPENGRSMAERKGILAWSKRTWAALAAALLVGGAWVGSHWGVARVSDGARWSVFVGVGRLGFERYIEGSDQLGLAPTAGVQVWSFTGDDNAAWPETVNTRDWITTDITLSWLSRTTVLIWPLAAALAGLAVWTLVRERRCSRLRAGACVECGYSLAGLEAGPGGVVCPECGASRA